MKKLLALILTLSLSVLALVGCKGGDEDPEVAGLDAVKAMYAISQPTKVVATTTHQFGSNTLIGTYVLTTGYIDGDTPAATYKSNYQKMRDIDSGSGQQVLGPIEDVETLVEYVEGKGTRETVNGKRSSWKKDGESIIPAKGVIAINLDASIITQFTYENNVLTFTVPAASTETVLGKAIAADTLVVITTNGVEVIGISISYTETGNAEINMEQTAVSIEVEYTYDLETVTIG